MYLVLKSRFYLAYAYNYAGENLLAEDKCGEAIRALQESQKCEYSKLLMNQQQKKLKNPTVDY
jgi:hypothetical protein